MNTGLLKRVIFMWTIAIVPIFEPCIHAQMTDRRQDFSIGLNIGASLNTVNFQPIIKQNMKLGPVAGINARYICEKYFNTICGVQMELNYSMLGWSEDTEKSSVSYYRTMPYIQMPILMQLGWGKEKKGAKFIFEAGPQIGVSLGSFEHQQGDDSQFVGSTKQHGMKQDTYFDYGIIGGLGVEFSKNKRHFIVSARYYFGLANVFDDSKKGVFARSAQQTIMMKCTYLYDINSIADIKGIFKSKKKPNR